MLRSLSRFIPRARSFSPPAIARPRVVVVGTGWGGSRVARDLDLTRFSLVVVSIRNHVIFTPLLAQTTTGTLEFRTVCESIRKIQPGLANTGNEFYMAVVKDVDVERKVVMAQALDSRGQGKVHNFEVPYDYLVLAHGAKPNIFGTKGIEHCYFLREVTDARAIRSQILNNLSVASLPTTPEIDQRQLLKTVIVGGGPIGTEFAGDLCDFMREDIAAYFPRLKDKVTVTLIEPHQILGSFESRLRDYVTGHLTRQGVEIVKASVQEVTKDHVILHGGRRIDCGLVVWGTGIGPSNLTRALPFDHNSAGRLDVDEFLRVRRNKLPIENVFAVGDCGGLYPGLAAVANQQGKYLARSFNKGTGLGKGGEPFRYRHLGSMTTIGGFKGVADTFTTGPIKGFTAFLMWRAAYFTMIGTLRSRMYMAVNWLGSFVWGRDFTFILDMDHFRKAYAIEKKKSGERVSH